jgi:phage shock protein E
MAQINQTPRKFSTAIVIAALAGLAAFAGTAHSKDGEDIVPAQQIRASNVDYGAFEDIVRNVAPLRQKRLVDLAQFKQMAAEPGTIILDARSADAFAAGHIEGAINLPFTDFTSESLARVIGDPNQRVLIYCNNNFVNDTRPVPMKAGPLALNIATFVNLYGYGYKNIHELREMIDFNDPAVGWTAS